MSAAFTDRTKRQTSADTKTPLRFQATSTGNLSLASYYSNGLARVWLSCQAASNTSRWSNCQ